MKSRKQKRRIAARRRILFLERLESREVLAGNVSASVRGGDLFVTGDGNGNDITITRSGPSSLTITGNNTTINGHASVTLNNFHDDLIINLKGGNDTLTFERTIDDLFRLPDDLTVVTGNGNDHVNFSDIAVKGHLTVNTGNGNDQVNAAADSSIWGLRVFKSATILTGRGQDVVSLEDSYFHKATTILLQRDNDHLFLNHTAFKKTTVLNGGLGFDRLDTVATSFAKRPVIVLFEARGSSAVPPVNNVAPVAANDAATVAEGASTSINVATNDTDSDGTLNLNSIVVTQNPANGTVIVNSNGTVSYTHNGSNTTSDSFRYTIEDNDGAVSNAALVNITITPVNDAPVAANDTATVAEAGTVSIPVSTNDTDSDGTIDLTSIVVTQNPANGSVVVNSNGSVSYTHNGSETTSDSFRYTIKDNSGAVSGTATVNITVTPVNDAPVAVNDTATLAEGATLAIPVSTNDTDADGTIDQTSIVVTQNPANGSVVVNSNGSVSYTHNGSETTSDSFRYTIKDNSGAVSGTATVNITITPVNDAPVAVNDTATIDEGASANIPVSTNDTDADGTIDPATIVITQAPANGSAVANANGTVTYTHNGSETTSDSFRYTIKDNSGAVSGTATVNVTITPVNDPPTAANDTATVAEGASDNIPVSSNDSDPEGALDLTSIVIIQQPANGTASANANGSVTYTHDGSNTTVDSFTYTIKDTTGAVSGTATVAITVTPVNDAPTAVNDTLTVNEGAGANVNVSTNDTDSDGTLDLTSVVITQAPANGTAVPNSDGTVTYTHNGSETTTDSFSYTIKDNSGAVSGTATVAVTVTPVNDAPVAVNDTLTVDEGAGGSVNVAANDTDADGTIDVATVVITQNPAHGSAVANLDGTVTYTNNGDEATSDSFRYTIKDNNGLVSNTGTVTVTVNPVNDAPVAVNDVLTLAEGSSDSVNVVANDTDADGTIDVATVVILQAPTNGNAVANADGTVTYTHNGSETTSDSFTYTVKDNNGLVSNTATVSITVTTVNDAPVAVNDVLTVTEGAGGSIDVTTNDTDVDGSIDVSTVVIGTQPLHGTAVANPNGTVTYTHDGSETTSDSFTYTVKDNNGLVSGTATVTVTITPANDAPVAVNDEFTIDEDGSLTLVAPGILGNDTDAEGNPLTAHVVDSPLHGTLSLTADGSLTYTPDPNFHGVDGFSYTANDGTSDSAVAAVTINVTSVNDAPVASNGTLTTDEDTPATGTLVATDVDTAPVTYSLVDTSNAHGTVTITDPVTGAYSYSPASGYSGPASFTFKANDGSLDSNTATITITVTPVNDAPVASDGTLTTAEDTPTTGTLVATDVDTAAVTYSLVDTSNAHGTVAITDPVTGAYSYSPDFNFSGPASFTFKANDGSLDSNTATITMTVTPVNDAPVAQDGALATDVDTPATGTLVATDVDTAAVTYSLVDTSNAHGTVTITDPVTGAYSYSPDSGYTGPASFTFKANDGSLDSNVATISITVTSTL